MGPWAPGPNEWAKWARAQGPNEWAQWARAQQGPNESPRTAEHLAEFRTLVHLFQPNLFLNAFQHPGGLQIAASMT